MPEPSVESGLVAQLESLYAERETLHRELGCSDAEGILLMFRSLEEQLADLYRTLGETRSVDADGALGLLEHIQDLSSRLGGVCLERSVTIEFENNKPVLKARWHQTLNDGGDS